MYKANSNSYTSFPVGMINLIPFNLLVFFIAIVFLSNIFDDWSSSWLAVVFVQILSNLLLIGSNYSKVTGNKTNITLSSLTKTISLDNIIEIKAWWCYDLSGSRSYQYSDTGTKMKLSASKMNCIVKFSSKTESVFILEEIHLGDKFPNHLPYSAEETIEEEKTLKVWDVDHCLSA